MQISEGNATKWVFSPTCTCIWYLIIFTGAAGQTQAQTITHTVHTVAARAEHPLTETVCVYGYTHVYLSVDKPFSAAPGTCHNWRGLTGTYPICHANRFGLNILYIPMYIVHNLREQNMFVFPWKINLLPASDAPSSGCLSHIRVAS